MDGASSDEDEAAASTSNRRKKPRNQIKKKSHAEERMDRQIKPIWVLNVFRMYFVFLFRTSQKTLDKAPGRFETSETRVESGHCEPAEDDTVKQKCVMFDSFVCGIVLFGGIRKTLILEYLQNWW